MVKYCKCPLCGSSYAEASGYSEGDICENEAMTGPNPSKCSPEHPCTGILIPVFEKEQDTD